MQILRYPSMCNTYSKIATFIYQYPHFLRDCRWVQKCHFQIPKFYFLCKSVQLKKFKLQNFGKKFLNLKFFFRQSLRIVTKATNSGKGRFRKFVQKCRFEILGLKRVSQVSFMPVCNACARAHIISYARTALQCV